MDLASVVAALASVGVRVSGSTPNSSVQVDSSRACPTGLASPEPSGTFHDPGQHFQAAKKGRAMVTSLHWWDDKMLVTGKYEKDEFVARVMDHIGDQYDGPVGSDPPTWDFPRMGAGSDKNSADAANFRRLSVGSMPHDDEDGISDEEKSDSDLEEAYTAVRSVVSIPKQAAEEAQENPKVAALKERLINAYRRLFSGVANRNPPDRGRFGIARIKLKPNPKIYRHREYQFQGDRAQALRRLLAEFIERGWIEPSDSEWASPAFIVPKKEKG